MREIDKYFFPYVDEINYLLDFNKSKYKENAVYSDIITGKDYRYVNGQFEELNKNWIFSSGLIDNDKFKLHLIRFLKEKHIMKEYIHIFLDDKSINRIYDFFNDIKFDLNNIFSTTTDDSLNFHENFFDKYQLFNRLYWKVITKIK